MRKVMLVALMLVGAGGLSMTETASAKHRIHSRSYTTETMVETMVVQKVSHRRVRRAKSKKVKSKIEIQARRTVDIETTPNEPPTSNELKAPSSEERVKALKEFHEKGNFEPYAEWLKKALAFYLQELYTKSKFNPLKVREFVRKDAEQRGIIHKPEVLDEKVRLLRRAVIEKGRGQQSGVLAKALEVADTLADYYEGLSYYDRVEQYRLLAAELDPTDDRRVLARKATADKLDAMKPREVSETPSN